MTQDREYCPNVAMTNPTTQRRLVALLVGTIYRIANGLFPVIDTIARQPGRPWQQRARLADRFSRILQQLLALTARIRPASLSRNPSFPILPKRPTLSAAAQPSPASTHSKPAPLRLPAPARLLSARQLAQRLATLLHQLEQLAAEIGAALPATIRRMIARARTLAGCNALPAMHSPSWERAG